LVEKQKKSWYINSRTEVLMRMKCGRCGGFDFMNAFKYVPEVDEYVCGNCFRELSAPAPPDADGDSEVFEDDLDDRAEETISQRANRIWRQRQIDRLEEEYEVLDAELDSLRDDIGYDRITMDEEDCLVGETIYGLQIQDRLEEIEKELVLLRSKQ
jgi:hypothetical protein